MKGIVRFGQKALVMGAAIAGAVVGINTSAMALPEATVIQKLSPIPMFMLINDQGQPIFSNIKDESGNSTDVTGVFVSLSEAENLVLSRRTESKSLLEETKAKPNADPKVVEQLTTQSALWEEANILPIGLDKVYEFAKSKDAADLNFKFLPTQRQLQAASQVTQQANFPGVPLFFLSMQEKTSDGKESVTFPTMASDDGTESGQIPVFFEVEPILAQLEGFTDKDKLSINVMPLEVFMAKLVDNNLSSEEQRFLAAMKLIPSEESSELIKQVKQQQQQQASPQAQPQVQPQAKPK